MFEPAKLQMNWASASGRINLRGDTTGLFEIRAMTLRPHTSRNAAA
jgi:hypothetical protein